MCNFINMTTIRCAFCIPPPFTLFTVRVILWLLLLPLIRRQRSSLISAYYYYCCCCVIHCRRRVSVYVCSPLCMRVLWGVEKTRCCVMTFRQGNVFPKDRRRRIEKYIIYYIRRRKKKIENIIM